MTIDITLTIVTVAIGTILTIVALKIVFCLYFERCKRCNNWKRKGHYCVPCNDEDSDEEDFTYIQPSYGAGSTQPRLAPVTGRAVPRASLNTL